MVQFSAPQHCVTSLFRSVSALIKLAKSQHPPLDEATAASPACARALSLRWQKGSFVTCAEKAAAARKPGRGSARPEECKL